MQMSKKFASTIYRLGQLIVEGNVTLSNRKNRINGGGLSWLVREILNRNTFNYILQSEKRGMHNLNSVPAPALEETLTWPPWSLTIRFTVVRPNPDP